MKALHMTILTFSSKGQVVIPKDVRDAMGFQAGAKVEMVKLPDGIMLKAVERPRKRPISELSEMLASYSKGPPVSVEEMHEGIGKWFQTDPQWKPRQDD
jgi:AbrB family looped-hinge helix DNA binding protein